MAIRGSTLANFVPVLISHKQNLLLQLSDTRSAVVKESALTIAIIFKVLNARWTPDIASRVCTLCDCSRLSATSSSQWPGICPPTSRQPAPPPPPLRECVIEAFKPIVGVKIISHSVLACPLSLSVASVYDCVVCRVLCVLLLAGQGADEGCVGDSGG